MNLTIEQKQMIVQLLQNLSRSSYAIAYRNGVYDCLDALDIDKDELGVEE